MPEHAPVDSGVSPIPAHTPLSRLTTMRVGGPAARLIEATTEEGLVAAALDVWADDEPWFVLGGGSNTVAADDGFDGVVILVGTTGIERIDAPVDAEPGTVRLRVQAGESWDDLVAYTVERGWAGIEALSGIPGSVGASPVQNIGAYGQELSSSLVAVTFVDFGTNEVSRIPAADLELGYRTSVFKAGRRGVVVAVELDLLDSASVDAESPEGARSDAASEAASEAPSEAPSDARSEALSRPVAYAQLASALGVEIGDRVPLTRLRTTVLDLRASKGMVLSDTDGDSVSAGSFFTNPIVGDEFARSLPVDAPRWPVAPTASADRVERQTSGGAVVTPLDVVEAGYPVEVPVRSERPRSVKLSAAWLIEHAGIRRGFSLPGSDAAISSKHTLAIINRGAATADDIAELARFVQGRVANEFGVILQPEPVLLGLSL